MRQADYIVDVGPGAGVHGGEIVAAGSVADICKAKRSITGAYLSGRKFVEVPATRREGNGKFLRVVQGTREQPAGYHSRFSAGQDDLRHRRVRLRKIDAGQ